MHSPPPLSPPNHACMLCTYKFCRPKDKSHCHDPSSQIRDFGNNRQVWARVVFLWEPLSTRLFVMRASRIACWWNQTYYRQKVVAPIHCRAWIVRWVVECRWEIHCTYPPQIIRSQVAQWLHPKNHGGNDLNNLMYIINYNVRETTDSPLTTCPGHNPHPKF